MNHELNGNTSYLTSSYFYYTSFFVVFINIYLCGEATGVFSMVRLGDAGADKAFVTFERFLFSTAVFLYRFDIKLFTAFVS